MSSQRLFGPARLVVATTAAVIFALITLVSAGPAPAGAPPNRLDDNTGDLVKQAAVNTLVTIPPFTALCCPFRRCCRPRSGL